MFGWHFWLALVRLSHYAPLTILKNIDFQKKGSRKVNGVAEVCDIPVLVNVQVPTGKQLHSELVRTTILKDFAEFEGISKYVYVWFGALISFLI
jgi:hypothetical protein